MEVELQTAIFPEIPRLFQHGRVKHAVSMSFSSPTFGETFSNSTSKPKLLVVSCSNSQKVQQPIVLSSDNDTDILPELSFNRLQPTVSSSDSDSDTDNLRLPELSFNRLQPTVSSSDSDTDQESDGLQTRHFSRYIAREAVLDEEFWTAAWLRAEAHWESVSYVRHIDTFKRRYAEQEFYALKKRCSGIDGNSLKCSCLVAVKREEKNARRTVLNSVVGTLDLSIRQFLQGETYPGDRKTSPAALPCQPFGAPQYAYVANVSVSKFARRQGIASNLLHLATDMAKLSGMKQLYVHVTSENKGAQDLYFKTGFKFVEGSSSLTLKDQRLLLMLKEL